MNKEQAQLLLLDLLSPVRRLTQPQIDCLTAREWNIILEAASEHRLEPLLWWQLKHHHHQLILPETIGEGWKQSYKTASLYALEMQRGLVLLHRTLEQQGIRYAALKGSYLAFFVYPEPGLRPLRDIDLLVAKPRVQEAFNVLLASGASRANHFRGDPQAMLEAAHQLPPLLFDDEKIVVEMHFQLFHSHSTRNECVDPSSEDSLWERLISRQIAGVQINFLGETDLLHHLVVHAVYGHSLDNGPLTLSDIAFLVDNATIDWPSFWTEVARSGHTRGAVLLLRLVEFYWGSRPQMWTQESALHVQVSDVMLKTAACLTLRSFESRLLVGLRSEKLRQSTLGDKLRMFWHRAFPSRTLIGTLFGVNPRSKKVLLYYPLKWLRLFTIRLPEIARGSTRGEAAEVQALVMMKAWLESD